MVEILSKTGKQKKQSLVSLCKKHLNLNIDRQPSCLCAVSKSDFFFATETNS